MIRLSDGEVRHVLRPECAALTKTKVVVTYPDEDRVVRCGLIHVDSLGALPRTRGATRPVIAVASRAGAFQLPNAGSS